MAQTSRTTSNESGTNVQEVGVDESDVVKAAGSLLLRMRDGELLAYDVSGDAPALLSSTPLDDARGNGWVGDPGGELVFVDGRAVVLGSSEDGRSATITTVDLPELDFSYPDGTFGEIRSRLRNRALVRDTTLADWLPSVDGEPVVECEDVAVPDDEEIALGTTTVLAFDPAAPTSGTSTAVATDSDTSYFSTDRFYLAAGGPDWGWVGGCIDCRVSMPGPDGTTPIFAFALDGMD